MEGAVARSLRAVLDRMARAADRAGRDPGGVRLVAVTKGVPVGAIREAVASGANLLGENRIQEALPKIAELGEGVRWHLVGSLQRNKARQAVGLFELIHSVDRPELAVEIDRRAAQKGLVQKVLVQVNVAGEAQKSGIPPEETESLVRTIAALDHAAVAGLMTVPPYPERAEDSRGVYRSLAELAGSIRRETGLELSELSMGMSRDFEIAIEEGATLVRIGSAIFHPGAA
jgi:pyridoxal phosphate enzyme (YggS family)